MNAVSISHRLVSGVRHRLRHRKPIRLEPDHRPAEGRVLLSYLAGPFRRRGPHPSPSAHTQVAEVVQMASTFLELGYAVDVISFANRWFTPRHTYDVFVDCRHNMERLSEAVGDDCVKIAHLDTANLVYQNAAEFGRLLDIQRRRGVTLPATRHEAPARTLDTADAGVYLGNDFTASTYAYCATPLYRTHLGGLQTFPLPDHKDYAAARRRFLWLGSAGFALKGLDLVLEAFASMPDRELVVCGPIDAEPEFARVFHRELWETPNIHTYGWLDLTSPAYLELARRCGAVVYASASECGGGSVINAMHAGLVPVVTYESSVDVADDYGVMLPDASIDAICSAVDDVATRSPEDLESMSVSAWKHARVNHTRERFASDYRAAVGTLLGFGP